MIAAEVPLHYLQCRVPGSPRPSAGVADARAWCREKGITLAETGKQDLMALTFSETMQGPFAMGATDPEEGRKKGLAAGTSLALHGNIRIDAFDRFVNEANHAGSLTGSVDFNGPAFGKGMPASKGVFNLFNPGGKGKEGLKHFIYEAAFEQGGKPYYLAGHKDVRQGGDLWGDTTTLYTRLHEGSDAKGKVIGAGVLTLGVDDLVALLRTVKVHNAATKPRT
jgi:cholesterol oxidase